MKLVGILAAVLLTIGAAVALADAGSDDGRAPAPVALGNVRLVSVDSCDALLDWFRTTASQTDAGALSGVAYGGMAVDTVGGGRSVATTAVPSSAMAEGSAADSTASGSAPAYSDTNVQERGVDEPDTVKTNGRVLVRATADKLVIVDLTGDAPKVVATMPIEQGGSELLLSGDRVLTLTNAWRQSEPSAPPAGDVRIMPVQGSPITVLTSIDISDPAHPREVARKELPGAYRTARVTGTTARVVLVAYPQVPAPAPNVYESPDGAVQQQRLQQWKSEAIASMTLKDWMPLASGDCSSVATTAQPEGLGTTSILTLDAGGDLDVRDTDSVVADANTVYASTDRLYIATSRWSQARNPAGEVSTELHGFDIGGPQTTYLGSGAVAGYLLNQFSLSAGDGVLRVATTQEAPWTGAEESAPTHSAIAVLEERDGALAEIGRVDGLGVTERIQAVRFLGDTAYVVTFRQKDPLYVIDLSNPRAPRVAGQLTVPGYSAYLHPIDGDRLLGIGQDATADGQTTGTQVATFDVADPAAPTRIDVKTIEHGSSPVEYDHHAFLWWDPTRTLVVPVQIFDPGVIEPSVGVPETTIPVECAPDGSSCSSPGSTGSGSAPTPARPPSAQPFVGAIVFHVADDGSLTEVGRVTHAGHTGPQSSGTVDRSLVVGDALYTLSDAGVLKTDLSSLADEGFAPFPAPTYDAKPMPVEG